jgi:hypothetical protein
VAYNFFANFANLGYVSGSDKIRIFFIFRYVLRILDFARS